MITDNNGAKRYTMTNDELYKVYKKFEDFVADCTTEEYIENKSSIDAVFSLIHKHQQRARFNYLTDLIEKYSKQKQEGYMLDINSRHNLLLAIRELANFGTEEADGWVVKGRNMLKRKTNEK